MLAHELGLAGVPALVVDGAEPDARTPLGMAINAGVVELLEQRGLMAPLRELGMEIPQAHFAHLWLDPTRLPGGHPYTLAIPYDAVERCLAEAARQRSAEIRYATAVAGLAQDADGVTVELRSPAGVEKVRCGYLVGCD